MRFPTQLVTSVAASAACLLVSASLALASGGHPPPPPPPPPPTPTLAAGALTLGNPATFSGVNEQILVQVTNPSLADSVLTVTSSNPTIAPVAATTTVFSNSSSGQIGVLLGQVTTPTPVTVTATLNATSQSISFTVQPPTLASVTLGSTGTNAVSTGGATTVGTVNFNGAPPSAGAIVTLTSSIPSVASVPTALTVPAGQLAWSFNIPTTAVTASTTAVITASWQGISSSATLTIAPQVAPVSLTLSPTVAVQFSGSTGTVTVASAPLLNTLVFLSSSNPAQASVPQTVTVAQGATQATFPVFTTVAGVTTTTPVTISATGAGKATTAILTLQPPSTVLPLLASLTLSATSVVGGGSVLGTVTLTAPAPFGTIANPVGGTVVSVSSGNTSVATTETRVTVPPGHTTQTFFVDTGTPRVATAVTIAATCCSVGGTKVTTLTVAPAGAPAPPTTDTVKATLAQYDVAKQTLQAQATSTSAAATVIVSATSSGATIGTLNNVGGGKYEGQFPLSVNPQSITVNSSLGGSATLRVAAK